MNDAQVVIDILFLLMGDDSHFVATGKRRGLTDAVQFPLAGFFP